ncbi:MAG: hypothetical protein GKR89_17080 [Candidatus Latescibacteria bacterium]|nr:hypothetical protein [Candidatus Latescibacterota bacterium]
MPFKTRELKIIIGWKEKVFWPDEARVLKKLRRALQKADGLRLSRVQIQIIHGWAEEQLGALRRRRSGQWRRNGDTGEIAPGSGTVTRIEKDVGKAI